MEPSWSYTKTQTHTTLTFKSTNKKKEGKKIHIAYKLNCNSSDTQSK